MDALLEALPAPLRVIALALRDRCVDDDRTWLDIALAEAQRQNVGLDTVLGRSHARAPTRARRRAWVEIRRGTNGRASYPQIGHVFGVDHTTVLKAVRKAEREEAVSHAYRGAFVAIEGADGLGKTTVTKLVAGMLRAHGQVVAVTREPSVGPIGRMARDVLRGHAAADGIALPQLFAADRADHIAREIGPARARADVVLCDRYSMSGLVYVMATTDGPFLACSCGWSGEPGGKRHPCKTGERPGFAPAVMARMRWASELDAHAPLPDLTVVLTAPGRVARQRLQDRRGAAERFDDQRIQARARAAYARAFKLQPQARITLVNAEAPEHVVARRVTEEVLLELNAIR